jgi:hypothetical protein
MPLTTGNPMRRSPLKMLRSAFVDADQLRDHAIALGLPICNIEAL